MGVVGRNQCHEKVARGEKDGIGSRDHGHECSVSQVFAVHPKFKVPANQPTDEEEHSFKDAVVFAVKEGLKEHISEDAVTNLYADAKLDKPHNLKEGIKAAIEVSIYDALKH